MAEALARALASDVMDPLSAGTEPAGQVDPKAIEVMREAGIDISGARPKALSREAAEGLDLVVHMGCGSEQCLVVPGVPTEEWHVEDPAGKGTEAYRRARELVRAKVVELAERLRGLSPEDLRQRNAPSFELKLR